MGNAATAKLSSVPTNSPPPTTDAKIATNHSIGPNAETFAVNAKIVVTAHAATNMDHFQR